MALIVKIGADLRNFDKEMKKLTKDTQAIGDKLKGIGTALTAAITVPLVGVGVAATKVGMEFEASMSKVAAISGATGDEFIDLEKKARELGATTKFSASEAADAFSYMAMAGWDTQQMLSGIDGVMSLAAASGEDLALVSDIVTDALTAFGMSAADSGRFADVLAAASSNANTNVSMLGESFKYVAPVAGALGMTAEDTSKALGLMANAGIKGSQSGTALRTMLTNLASPTAGMKEAMDELGISLTNTDGSMKTLDEVMLNLRSSFDGLNESQQAAYAATIFGKEAMSGALAIINASEQDYNKLSYAINNSNGAAKDMADIMSDNLAGRMKELKSAMEEMGLVIYERLKPALEVIVGALKGAFDWFNNLSPTVQTLIIALGGLAAAIGPVLLAIGTGIVLFGQMSAALTVLGTSFGALVAPIGLAVAAVAGIIAIFVLFGDDIRAFWDEYFKPVMDQIINTLVKVLQPTFDKVFKTVSNIVKDCFNIIKRLWNEVLRPLIEAILSYMQTNLIPTWEVIFAMVASLVSDAFDAIDHLWNYVLKPILNGIITFISGVFTGNWSKAWQGIVNIFEGIFAGLKAAAKAPLNAIISMINAVIRGMNRINVSIPDWVPGVGGERFGINIPTLPMLATGGEVFGSGAFITGEAGPELVQKSGSSVKVTPLSAQEKGNGITGALGGNQVIEIPLYLDGYEIARATYDHMDRLQGNDLTSKLRISGVR